MPNHVHCLLVQRNEWPTEKVLHSWKRYTAGSINKLLKKAGSLWQSDYSYCLIRNQNHFANGVGYIRNNPRNAGCRSVDVLITKTILREVSTKDGTGWAL
jgi:REP element-mobilizing transposase RayT